MKKFTRVQRIIIAAILIIISFFANDLLEDIILLSAYLIVGYDVLLKAFKNILRGNFFDEFFLMGLATMGAILLREFFEAAEVMLFYQIGESFQSYASTKSVNAIQDLLEELYVPVHVNVDGQITEMEPDEVEIGSLIVVMPGEKVPIDGIIVEGASSVNTSNLTGESVPRFLEEGDEILSGMVNLEGALTVKTDKSFENSAMMKILEMIEDASAGGSTAEAFITRFARFFTPIVVIVALSIAILPAAFNLMPFSQSVRRALMMLVVSCPCALLIAVPLSFFGVIGGLSKKGILVKNPNAIENLARTKQIVLDKTGTLTRGVFKVIAVHPTEYSEEELLRIAAFGESLSKHPIALSIMDAYGESVNQGEIKNYKEIAGYGIEAEIFGKDVLIGNKKLMKQYSINFEDCSLDGTVVHIAIDKKYQGHITIADEIKSEAVDTLKHLKKLGVKDIYMLTGDLENSAKSVSEKLGLTGFKAELLPKDKIDAFKEIRSKMKEPTAYVGDGMNDAPVLATAKLGISMGLSGAGVSMEEANVIITDDNISNIPLAIFNSKRAMRIVYENIIVPIAVKLIVLILVSMGLANMQMAIFADVGMLILAVLNATRTIKVKNIKL